MTILSLTRSLVGEVGNLPGSVKMVSTDNLATITAAGYIPNGVSSAAKVIGLSDADLMQIIYNFNVTTGNGTIKLFQPQIVNGVITLTVAAEGVQAEGMITVGHLAVFADTAGNIQDGGAPIGPLPVFGTAAAKNATDNSKPTVSSVLTPTTVGHLATFGDTAGSIQDGGAVPTFGTAASKAASNNADAILASVPNAGVGTTHIAKFSDVSGSIGDTPGVAVNLGDIQAGQNSTAGKFVSFAPTNARGSLIVQAADNAGNFTTTLTNASLNQSSNYIMPGTNVVNNIFMVDATGGISPGHLLMQGGSQGETADSGFGMTKVFGAAIAGGSATNTVVDANCTAASVVLGSFVTQANPAVLRVILPANGSFNVVTDADPGASTFSYVIVK